MLLERYRSLLYQMSSSVVPTRHLMANAVDKSSGTPHVPTASHFIVSTEFLARERGSNEDRLYIFKFQESQLFNPPS